MMPTPLELRMIHLAYRQAGLTEELYRMVLRNVAGVESAKLLSQRGLEDVMAVLEDSGFRHVGKPADYCRSKVATRGSFVSAPLAAKIVALVGQQKYDLAGLCRRASNDRACRVDRLTPVEGYRLCEMLKGIVARESRASQGLPVATEAAGGTPVARVEAGTASETVPEPAGL